MNSLLIYLIELYQKTFSPDHGWFAFRHPYGLCRHYPSCSEYTKLCIAKYGSFRGVIKGFARVLRCNPFIEPRIEKV